MANHKSALKRARQNIKRNLRNRSLRTALRTILKKYRALLEAKQVTEAQSGFPLVQKALDRAVTKGVLHKNTANRQKSRLSDALKKIQAA